MIESLTPREREVLQLIATGRSTKALAADLGIAFKTAACHRATILAKLGAANTADLICRTLRMELIDVQVPDQHPIAPIACWVEAVRTEKPGRDRSDGSRAQPRRRPELKQRGVRNDTYIDTPPPGEV